MVAREADELAVDLALLFEETHRIAVRGRQSAHALGKPFELLGQRVRHRRLPRERTPTQAARRMRAGRYARGAILTLN